MCHVNGGCPLVTEGLSATAIRNQILPMVTELGRGLKALDETAALADAVVTAW